MACEQFVDKRFARSTLDVVEQANTIIEEYMAQGFVITLRQLYYQFVARGLLENKQQNYKRLGGIVSDGRLAGLIDWRAIEDRTRSIEQVPSWDDPQSVVSAVAEQYKIDLWEGQEKRCEVWIEKEALVGVIEPICRKLRLPWFACRGYASQSAQYEASKRFRRHIRKGASPIVLHLGDHDPSGIDMTRENREKIELLVGEPIEFRRLALNMNQVEQYNPPPNPAKETDSRFEGYRRRFGDQSWELDALDPPVIAALIGDEVNSFLDANQYARMRDREQDERDILISVSDRWDEVAEFVR